MSVSDLVQQGWNDHADDAEGVWQRLPAAIEECSEGQDVLQLAALGIHVSGEHLGRWDDGLAFLSRLGDSDAAKDAAVQRALHRQAAVLLHCAGRDEERDAAISDGTDPDEPEGSSRARVFAIATSALSEQGRAVDAAASFRLAIEAANYGPGSDDPAARSLAITGNNLACALEEKESRSAEEDALLREAAHVARRFWELAGTWVNVKRAEYRLAMTHLALGEAGTAREHAAACLRLSEEHEATGSEFFFGHEAMARAAALAAGDAEGARSHRDSAAACLDDVEDEGMKGYCAGELTKLDARLGLGG